MSGWSDWRTYDGKGCPVPRGAVVTVLGELPDGSMVAWGGPCDPRSPEWDWTMFGREVGGVRTGRVRRYRERRYSAAANLIAGAKQPSGVVIRDEREKR